MVNNSFISILVKVLRFILGLDLITAVFGCLYVGTYLKIISCHSSYVLFTLIHESYVLKNLMHEIYVLKNLILSVFKCTSSSLKNAYFLGLVPVPIRPPNFHNVITTLPTVKMIVEVSKASAIMTTIGLIKLLRSKEAQSVVETRQWPPLIPTEDLPKKKLSPSYRPSSSEMVAYLDFSVSTTGMLAGVKVYLYVVMTFFESLLLLLSTH